MKTQRIKLWPVVTVLVLLTLLPLLAYLQYRWQEQVSVALRNRLQEQIRTAAGQFSEDFDRQIVQVYESFQTALPKNRNVEQRADELRNTYAELFSRWNQTAPYSKLVSDVFLIPRRNTENDQIDHLNPSTGRFEAIAWPEDFTGLRTPSIVQKAIGFSLLRLGPATGKLVQLAPTIDRRIPAVVIPIVDLTHVGTEEGRTDFQVDPASGAEAIIKLNLEYIRTDFIPELARKHLSNIDGTAAYNFTIVDRAEPPRLISSSTGSTDLDVRGDVTVPIFTARLLEIPPLALPQLLDLHKFENSLRHDGGNRFSFQIQNTERFLASGFDATPSSWQLVLTHQAGSLDAAVERQRVRNLAVGFGILLLLAISITLTFLSAQRERRLAQQQMEFVSAVSHELRTPLAVICSAGENLADGVVFDPAQTREYGALVRSEGRRLTEMVEQVLDFAGIQAGKKTYRFEPVIIREIIDRALETFELQIRESGVAVEKRLPMNLPPIVADRSALVRAMQNLIGNALKYGQAGNWLSVRAESTSEHVNLIVEDHGSGISAVDLSHIFEPFYRARTVVDAQIKGSGLGLSLVKQIVEAHGATITVETAIDRGTLFKIAFPVRDTAPDSAIAKSENDEQAYSPR